MLAGSGVPLVALNLPGGATWLGMLLVLAAAASWATANLIVKRIRADPLPTVIWASARACVPIAAGALAIDGPARMAQTIGALGIGQWLGLASQAWPTTLLALGIWAWLLRAYPVVLIAPIAQLVRAPYGCSVSR